MLSGLRKILLLNIVLIAMLMATGCRADKPASDREPLTGPVSAPYCPCEMGADYKQAYDSIGEINICNVGINVNIFSHKDGKPIGFQYGILDDVVTLEMGISIDINDYEGEPAFPVKVWLVEGNDFVEFSLDDGPMGKEQTIEYNEYKKYILKFQGKKDMKCVSVIVHPFSDYIPNNYTCRGVCVYPFINALNDDNINAPGIIRSDEDYVKVEALECNRNMGISNLDIEHEDVAGTSHGMSMDVDPSEEDIWVKYNYDAHTKGDAPINTVFSIMVLCDGRPFPFADGEYLKEVYTPYSKDTQFCDRAFQFRLDMNALEPGQHVFQAIAVPEYVVMSREPVKDFVNSVTSCSTFRMKVNAGKE